MTDSPVSAIVRALRGVCSVLARMMCVPCSKELKTIKEEQAKFNSINSSIVSVKVIVVTDSVVPLALHSFACSLFAVVLPSRFRVRVQFVSSSVMPPGCSLVDISLCSVTTRSINPLYQNRKLPPPLPPPSLSQRAAGSPLTLETKVLGPRTSVTTTHHHTIWSRWYPIHSHCDQFTANTGRKRYEGCHAVGDGMCLEDIKYISKLSAACCHNTRNSYQQPTVLRTIGTSNFPTISFSPFYYLLAPFFSFFADLVDLG